jgi:hypothetical protein
MGVDRESGNSRCAADLKFSTKSSLKLTGGKYHDEPQCKHGMGIGIPIITCLSLSLIFIA